MFWNKELKIHVIITKIYNFLEKCCLNDFKLCKKKKIYIFTLLYSDVNHSVCIQHNVLYKKNLKIMINYTTHKTAEQYIPLNIITSVYRNINRSIIVTFSTGKPRIEQNIVLLWLFLLYDVMRISGECHLYAFVALFFEREYNT